MPDYITRDDLPALRELVREAVLKRLGGTFLSKGMAPDVAKVRAELDRMSSRIEAAGERDAAELASLKEKTEIELAAIRRMAGGKSGRN